MSEPTPVQINRRATAIDELLGKAGTALQPDDVGAAAISNSYTDLDDKPTIPTLPAQMSPEEIAAATETATRLSSPADIKAIVTAHAPSGGGWDGNVTDIDLANATDIGEAIADDDEFLLLNVSAEDPAPSIVKATKTRLWTWVKSKMADLGGSIIGSYRNAVVTDVTGSLTTASHSGKHLITSGNIVVPNGAGDVGFSAVIRGGGAHTITFDGSVVRTLETDEIVSVFVESTTSMALFVGSVDTEGTFMHVVSHGSTADTARPAGAVAVYWIGTVEPTNAVDGDLWIGGA
jgi:hypothetical protein